MASLVDLYNHYMLHGSDQRTKDWLLIGSPWPTVTLVILYLLAVQYGQRVMAHRTPFDLKGVMVVYNVCLVLLSVYMVYELLISSWFSAGFNMHCALVDTSNNAISLRFASVVWWYYFSKLIEFADTMFFVLRKKNSQITYLHLYHHSSMPLLWWMGTRFAPGGEAFFCATLNSGVHVVMYMYYLLSAMGPRIQPYLWWKKYLTIMQLGQFVLVLARVTYTVFTGCQFPRLFQKILMVYMYTLIAFFSNFFYHAYHRPRTAKVKANGQAATGHRKVQSNGGGDHVLVGNGVKAAKKD
ncbi:very long chain fatty acid elongase 1-like isoform X2 [Littorina saxatilis]